MSDFVKELRERLQRAYKVNRDTAREDFDFGVARGLQKATEILDDSKWEWDLVEERRQKGMPVENKWQVLWIDCEGQEGWTPFETRGEAEQFAQWCHELGDTEIRVKEIQNENKVPV